MPFYAASVVAFTAFLHVELTEVKQAWLVDDCTAAGSLCTLSEFFNMIIIEGEKYGCFVNTGKSWLIIKNSCDLGIAFELFKDHQIKLSTEGQRPLGAVLVPLLLKRSMLTTKCPC